MKDIKVIAIKDILVVSRVDLIPNFNPPSVVVTGLKFLQADEVMLNDISVPEFMITSSTKILAQIPESQVKTVIRKISVFATKPSPDRKSLLLFEVGQFKGLSGLQRMIQHFTKMVIQTPGSDAFNPNDGGGLLSLVGMVVGRQDATALQATIVSAVTRVRDQIVTKQSRNPQIPPDERLLRADVIAAGFDPNTSTLAARVSIGVVSGQEAVANLTF